MICLTGLPIRSILASVLTHTWRKQEMPDWPHAPIHRLEHAGAFMVTCGTYRKEHFFRELGRLTLLQDTLFSLADELNWLLQAWAIFSTTHHLVAISHEGACCIS